MSTDGQRIELRKTLPKISIAWVGARTLQTTDDRQTDGRWVMTYSERERECTVANYVSLT